MKFLYLLASLGWGQSTHVPIEDLGKAGAVQGLHQEFDRRFAVTGGTITGNVYISSPVFINDGEVPTKISSNVWTHLHTYISSVTFLGPVLGTINQSTYTLLNVDIGVSASELGPCVDGTTLTLTTDSVPIIITFSGHLNAEAANTQALLGLLIDGGFVAGVTAAQGLVAAPDSGLGGTIIWPVSFSYRTRTALSQASHTLCLTASSGTGTATLDCSPGACNLEAREFH